jgi:hypothetical protein
MVMRHTHREVSVLISAIHNVQGYTSHVDEEMV